jgi:hypothetical protein
MTRFCIFGNFGFSLGLGDFFKNFFFVPTKKKLFFLFFDGDHEYMVIFAFCDHFVTFYPFNGYLNAFLA